MPPVTPRPTSAMAPTRRPTRRGRRHPPRLPAGPAEAAWRTPPLSACSPRGAGAPAPTPSSPVRTRPGAVRPLILETYLLALLHAPASRLKRPHDRPNQGGPPRPPRPLGPHDRRDLVRAPIDVVVDHDVVVVGDGEHFRARDREPARDRLFGILRPATQPRLEHRERRRQDEDGDPSALLPHAGGTLHVDHQHHVRAALEDTLRVGPAR